MSKLQNCSTLHYINAIKGGSVSKVLNVNSRRKPSLVFKSLKNIYEVECASNFYEPSKVELQDGFENGVVEHTVENSCQPMTERMTREREHESTISDCSGNSDEIVSELDDLSFGEMTLKQLKKRCKTKKRKMSDLVCSSPVFQQEEDDCDLTTPLSSWNIKLPKRARYVMKRVRRSASTILEHDCSFKAGQIVVAKFSQQLSSGNCTPMAIKVEVSPVCCSELQIVSFGTDANDGSSSSDEEVNTFDMDSTKLLPTPDTVLENKETISLAGQYETRVDTISCRQLDDDVMPLSVLPPPCGKTAGLSTQEACQESSVSLASELHEEADIMQSPSCQSFLLIDKQVYDKSLVINSQSCSTMQEISGNGIGDNFYDVPLDNGNSCTEIVLGSELCILQENARYMPDILSNESEHQVSNAATNDSLCCTKSGQGVTLSVFEDITRINMPHYMPNGSLRSPFCCYSSPWNLYPCSASDSDLFVVERDSPTTEDDWSLVSTNSNTAGYCLEPNPQLTYLEDASYANEKQLLLPISTDAEISFSSNAASELPAPENNNHDDVVRWQPPERFPSTRKVISPTSQEKLCLAMKFRELNDDTANYKCMGKLFFENQTEDNALSAASDTAGVEAVMTGELTEKVTLTKASSGPKKILKKPKHNKKGSPPKRCSPPKGRLEGSHLTRLLSGVCNGRNSIEACQESAIAFSQRQMQDIESIAVKLMTELKSMKDIVEEKLPYEAYRCTSMKNDSDEVKSAIKSATRVEETTKKWLSMMARDCNRFCKIMSQPQRTTVDASAAMKNIMRKEKKKISFADEAGGVLCHVKYIEDGENNTKVAS